MNAFSFCGSFCWMRLHHVVVVAHQDVKALVDAGRVLELLVGVAGAERRNGGVEGGRVAHAGVLVAGGERAGDAAHRAAVRVGRAVQHFGFAFFLGPHLAGDVHLRPGDVAVHVDAARHHDQAAGIDLARGPNGRIGRRGDDLAAGDPQIAHLAVDAVGRVVDGAAGDFDEVGHTAVISTTNDRAPMTETKLTPLRHWDLGSLSAFVLGLRCRFPTAPSRAVRCR